MIDTVKRAEDGDDLIVRLYEAHGGRGVGRLRVGSPSPTRGSPTCWRTASRLLRSTADEIVVPFRPFEIVTVSLGRPRAS